MKNPNVITIFALFLAGIIPTQAQVFTPPAPSSGGGGSSSGGGQNNTTVVNQNNQPQNNKPLAGNELPFLDPTNNNFSFAGQKFNIKENDIFKARFEKFLNVAESEDEAVIAYRKTMREILDILSPHNRNSGNKLSGALARMQHASAFEQDARLCESISNAVYRMFLAKKNVAALKVLNQQLAKERKQLDWGFKHGVGGSSLVNQERKGKSDAASATQSTGSSSEAARYVLRIAEKEKARVANFAKMELSETQARLEFQALIVQLFAQRRFEHVIMATRVYTEFFGDGAGKLDFEQGSEVEKMFSESIGFNPTVTTLDTFSNEAIRDVKQQVESFEFLVERGEIDTASRQLQQAFVTGEFLPSVQAITRDNKRKIQAYVRNAFQLVNAFDVKDYTLAEKLVKEMRAEASDFDYSKATAAIETARLTSNMKLRSAKNAALRGDNETFEKLLTEATMIWPTNPSIQTEFNSLADAGDSQQQAKLEFDRLLSTQSYRQIFTNKAVFIAATVDDPERQEQLNQILTNIQEIEISLKQAETLKNSGNGYAAWEIVEKTFQKFPDDVALSAKRSDYSTDVAEFVKALKKAENLEKRGQRGSSLAWFLSARRIYPQSENAADGIKRLVDDLLPEESSSTEGASL